MSVVTCHFKLEIHGLGDIHDITLNVSKSVERSGFNDGIARVFVPGSTAEGYYDD